MYDIVLSSKSVWVQIPKLRPVTIYFWMWLNDSLIKSVFIFDIWLHVPFVIYYAKINRWSWEIALGKCDGSVMIKLGRVNSIFLNCVGNLKLLKQGRRIFWTNMWGEMHQNIQVVWGETMATETCGVTNFVEGGFFVGKVRTENVIKEEHGWNG